jgi:predicted Rossmann fold nucleotide-binding protein DprA/Smf involved in DNA uptake
MITHCLTPDTQAILLLCASFGKSRDSYPEPLSLKEYNSFASWLRQQHLRPADILRSTESSILSNCDCLDSCRLKALVDRGMLLAIAVEKWTNQGLWILGRGDSLYPARLKQQLGLIAPPILYGVGDIRLLSQGGLAVVGSRDVDEDGLLYTEQVADSCARQGIQIVSGGARGVDRTSMLSALSGGGTVIGLLADSLAKSAISIKYRSAIQNKQLTLVSAVDPHAGFNVGNAMGRNKYIYALADYGLVVSSDYNKGGTWAGAIEALNQEKKISVFVRSEGNIPNGNKQLLKRSAKPFPNRPWSNNLHQQLSEASINIAPLQMIQVGLFPDNQTAKTHNNPENSLNQEVECKTIENIPSNIYDAVLPLILNLLQQPLDDKSLAQNLDVNLMQLRAWLNKAINDGWIIKKSKPVRYVSKSSH